MSEAAEYGARLRALADQLHEMADAIDPDGSERLPARPSKVTVRMRWTDPGGPRILRQYFDLAEDTGREVIVGGVPVVVAVRPA